MTEQSKTLATDKPCAARMYDYFLGGVNHFPIDREAAERVLAIHPDVRLATRANRAFLGRAVRFLVAEGIDQFLDVGSGIPTSGNVHEIAQAYNSTARVVYVDKDPVAVALSQSLLDGIPQTAAILGDMRDPHDILQRPEVQATLDMRRPVGLILAAAIQFVVDNDEAHAILRTFREALAPGSYLVLSHVSNDDLPPDVVARVEQIYARSADPSRARTRSEIEQLFEGFELVKPGLVYVPLWKPDGPNDLALDTPERAICMGGVGRKQEL
jgi:hypothetical protein